MCDFVKSLYNIAQIKISAFFFSGMFYLLINFIPLSSFHSNTEKVQRFPAPLPPKHSLPNYPHPHQSGPLLQPSKPHRLTSPPKSVADPWRAVLCSSGRTCGDLDPP